MRQAVAPVDAPAIFDLMISDAYRVVQDVLLGNETFLVLLPAR